MTKRLEDLIKSFSDSSIEEQLERIRHIRSARNIERPAAAVKKVKKAAKKSNKAMGKARDLLANLNPEQRANLLKVLQEKK